VLFGPGTVPVTGLVGADVAGDATGDVIAGSFAVTPSVSEQAANPKSAAAIGTTSESFLIIVSSPSV
jgi:hypothetical protein